jgi:hypothetical protein
VFRRARTFAIGIVLVAAVAVGALVLWPKGGDDRYARTEVLLLAAIRSRGSDGKTVACGPVESPIDLMACDVSIEPNGDEDGSKSSYLVHVEGHCWMGSKIGSGDPSKTPPWSADCVRGDWSPASLSGEHVAPQGGAPGKRRARIS